MQARKREYVKTSEKGLPYELGNNTVKGSWSMVQDCD